MGGGGERKVRRWEDERRGQKLIIKGIDHAPNPYSLSRLSVRLASSVAYCTPSPLLIVVSTSDGVVEYWYGDEGQGRVDPSFLCSHVPPPCRQRSDTAGVPLWGGVRKK